MKSLNSISPEGLAILSSLIGVALVLALDNESLDVIGNVLVGIGGILLIAAAQGSYLEGIEDLKLKKEELEKQLKALNKKIIRPML